MNRLARFLILAALSFVLGFYVTPVGFAQAKSAGQKTTLTGCLQKGQNTWATKCITGNFKAESYEKEKGEREEHEKKEAAEAGDIRVTNLKMVSDSCK